MTVRRFSVDNSSRRCEQRSHRPTSWRYGRRDRGSRSSTAEDARHQAGDDAGALTGRTRLCDQRPSRHERRRPDRAQGPGARRQALRRAARLRATSATGRTGRQQQHRGRPAARRTSRRAATTTTLINKALDQLDKAAAVGGGRSLYEANQEVYDLLRYGVKVKPEAGEQHRDRLADRLGATRGTTTSPSPRRSRSLASTPSGPTSSSTSTASRSASSSSSAPSSSASPRASARTSATRSRSSSGRSSRPSSCVMAGNDVEGLRYGVIDTPREVLAAVGARTAAEPRGQPARHRALQQLCSQGAAAGADPRLHRLRRRRQEDLPAQPVLRRQGGAGAGRRRAKAGSSGTPRARASA